MSRIELSKKISYVAVELLKIVIFVIVGFLVGFPLFIKVLEWFCGLWGYTL